MSIHLQLPPTTDYLKPHITVVGVGGAGGNAVNNMITSKLEGVNFITANTDAQALSTSLAEKRVQLGSNVTGGLGAGASPDTGRAAAEESLEEIESLIQGTNMLFITAGMGGGTGTGASPVIARLAREMGVLTVGVVTKPFQFEGAHRMRLAERGVAELQSFVDTLIVIPNQNLFRIANEKTTFADAFAMADEVLHSGVRGVTDLMVMPGLINLDFADIRAVMGEMGKAVMGTGEAEGDRRALDAAEAAISNPLLDDMSMQGARGMLINVTGGPDMTLFEVDEVANRVRDEVDPDANIIFGATFNDALMGKIRVSVVATGIGKEVTQSHDSSGGTVISSLSRGGADGRKFYTRTTPAPSVAVSERVPDFRASAAVRNAPAPVPVAEPVATRLEPVEAAPAPAPVISVLAEKRETVVAIQETPVPAEREPELFQKPESSISPAAFGRPRGSFTKQPERAQTTVQPQPQAVDKERDEVPTFKFMQKFAGVGKALTTPQPTRQEAPRQTVTKVEAVVERPQQPVHTRPATGNAGSEGEEYLDIPAFLRRQAN
jgi:cell division protein FtsZ